MNFTLENSVHYKDRYSKVNPYMILILHRRPQKGIKIINSDHVEINADEVESSALFYNMILGFDKVFVFNHWAVLQSDMSALINPENNVRLTDNICFKVNSEDQLVSILNRLNATGHKISASSPDNIEKELNISFSDPSGNLISLLHF